MRSLNILVIGGESQMGRALVSRLKQAGQHVHATYFHNDQIPADRSFLDLSGDITRWQIPEPIDAAILCAGITSLDQCRTQPDSSRVVNVENTLHLAKRIAQTGAAIFFPSSNLVFNGRVPFQKATAPINPCCEYGRQKAETEQGLTVLTEKVWIVRFTKIIGPDMALLRHWATDLQQGKIVHPFANKVLSPISLDFAIDVIIAIIQRERYGIWQVSANEDVTYEQIAQYLAHKMGVSQKLIKPVSVDQSELFLETNPEHTTLDTTRLKVELGITPPYVWDMIDKDFLRNSHDNRRHI
jgi:dTDP-4-dehydrorhamnose reductase